VHSERRHPSDLDATAFKNCDVLFMSSLYAFCEPHTDSALSLSSTTSTSSSATRTTSTKIGETTTTTSSSSSLTSTTPPSMSSTTPSTTPSPSLLTTSSTATATAAATTTASVSHSHFPSKSDPVRMLVRVCACIEKTVKQGGNVLLPVLPTGACLCALLCIVAAIDYFLLLYCLLLCCLFKLTT
jgi:hypothetical protein